MSVYTGTVMVEDASGARFYIHEYRRWRFIAWTQCFKLDTGDAARRLDAETFEIIATGETLVVCPG